MKERVEDREEGFRKLNLAALKVRRHQAKEGVRTSGGVKTGAEPLWILEGTDVPKPEVLQLFVDHIEQFGQTDLRALLALLEELGQGSPPLGRERIQELREIFTRALEGGTGGDSEPVGREPENL